MDPVGHLQDGREWEKYQPEACFAVVGAPVAYWRDPRVDCSALFVDGRWDSLDLFRRYW